MNNNDYLIIYVLAITHYAIYIYIYIYIYNLMRPVAAPLRSDQIRSDQIRLCNVA